MTGRHRLPEPDGVTAGASLLEVISFGVFDRLQMWGSLSGLCRMSCGSCS
ncbi:hypothetical protein J2Z21_009723, partial [Streptomyces griseochromogenes]|nr:hypothetical protein [Streptomyces griseochromogenes]